MLTEFKHANYILLMYDSGAPRGERRWWHVELNKIVIYESTDRHKCEEVFVALQKGLVSNH